MHSATTVLWQQIGNTAAAFKVGWHGFVVALVSIYIVVYIPLITMRSIFHHYFTYCTMSATGAATLYYIYSCIPVLVLCILKVRSCM